MKKNSFLILLFFILLALPMVNASEPDYTVTHLINEEFDNGVSDFGDLLFVEQPYKAESHYLEIIQDYTVQRYDKIRWNGDQALRIIDPSGQESIIVQGNDYYFSRSGTYEIFDVANSSNSAFIISNPEDENLITITKGQIPSGIDIEFSTTEFQLQDQKTVNAEITINDDFDAGIYEISYFINGDEHFENIKILQNKNWSFDYSDIERNPVVRAGEDLYLGRIIINNTGNMELDVLTEKVGDEKHMIVIPSEKTLFKKSQVFFDIEAQVPVIQNNGIYDFNIKFSAGGITKNVSIELEVVDNIEPVIEDYKFSSELAFTDNDIRVTATDNDNVANVTLSFNDETIVFDKDNNVFTATYNFNKLSMYEMTLCAFDDSDNSDCLDINKTFSRKKIITDYNKVLDMPSVQYGAYSEAKIFNITEDLDKPVTLFIKDLDVFGEDNASDVSFRITDSDGSIIKFSDTTKKVEITDAGEYFFEVKSDSIADYEGIIEVSSSEKYDQVDDITFNVGFKEYDIPQSFSMTWTNNYDLKCDVFDSGDLDSSYYSCSFRQPIDIRKDDISVPMTVEQKNKIDASLDEKDDKIKNQRIIIGIVASLCVALMIFGGFFIYYRIYLYPYVRVKYGNTKTDYND